MTGEQLGEVELDELVAVQGEDIALLASLLRREPQPAAPAKWLGLLHGDDLRPETVELLAEKISLPRCAAHEHALDARRSERRHLVSGHWPAGDRKERLRLPGCDVAEALRLPARQDDGFQARSGAPARVLP